MIVQQKNVHVGRGIYRRKVKRTDCTPEACLLGKQVIENIKNQ